MPRIALVTAVAAYALDDDLPPLVATLCAAEKRLMRRGFL